MLGFCSARKEHSLILSLGLADQISNVSIKQFVFLETEIRNNEFIWEHWLVQSVKLVEYDSYALVKELSYLSSSFGNPFKILNACFKWENHCTLNIFDFFDNLYKWKISKLLIFNISWIRMKYCLKDNKAKYRLWSLSCLTGNCHFTRFTGEQWV